MPEKPSLLVLQPLEKEVLEGVGCSFICKTVIKILIILIRFEPEFVRVREEESTEEEEDEDEAAPDGDIKRRLGHIG